MTSIDEAPEPIPADAPAPQAQHGEPELHEADERARPSREAARYRTRLREVEGQVETLTAHLAAARSAALDSVLARSGLGNVGDLTTLGGFDPATAWGEDGTLDVGVIDGAVAALRDARPELFRVRGPIIPDAHREPPRGAMRGPTFESAFGPHRT